MQACPQCRNQLEPWEVSCHHCGRLVSLQAVPVVNQASPAGGQIEASYKSWLGKGEAALSNRDFETASVSFQEALRRLSALPNVKEPEIKVRTLLAAALEGAGKLAEASEQYKLASEKTPDGARRRRLLDKLTRLSDRAMVDQYMMFSDKALDGFELKVMPLYCASCKRRLSEADLFQFRKGLMDGIRCPCGFQGRPLFRLNVEQGQIGRRERIRQGQKEKLIAAASARLPGGRRRSIAIFLAVFFGGIGGHKFYLGESGAGIWSIVLCWSFLPWLLALFEAVHLAAMSPATFNLTYNIDLLLERIPPPAKTPSPSRSDIFSMETGEDPEVFIDQPG